MMRAALDQALLSIDKMLEGGIYDHVGGGFSRYSTDAEWLAPHFEKMLYDNALLLNILCDAYQITKKKKYERAIREIIDFAVRELSDKAVVFMRLWMPIAKGKKGSFMFGVKKKLNKFWH